MDRMPYVDYLFGNGGCCSAAARECSHLYACHSWSCSACAKHVPPTRLLPVPSNTHPTRRRSAMRAENEARAFAKSEGWETEDVEEIALRVGGVPHSAGGC